MQLKCRRRLAVAAMAAWSVMPGALAVAASPAQEKQTCETGGTILPGGCVSDGARKVQAPDPVELLERVREKYAALDSYSDTGVVVLEEKPIGSTLIRERHTFATRYQAPRSFYFDFRKGSGASGERFVIWSPGDTFNSWWSATGVKEEYPRGEGANAFAIGALPTSGTALLIPALLFRNAGLQGPLVTLVEPKYGGTQKIDGRLMHVLTGAVPLNHWSPGLRVTSLWVDAETLMIRKVFEDTPTGQGDVVQRTTTTFEPKTGAALDDAHFRFVPPR